MDDNTFDEYSQAHLKRLKHVLADIYVGFGSLSENMYLVGGLAPDLLVKNKLVYLKEYLGTFDIDLAIKFAVNEKIKFRGFYKKLASMGFERQSLPAGRQSRSTMQGQGCPKIFISLK